MSEKIMSAEGVGMTSAVEVVDAASVQLAHNTSFIVAGPSGSGKTQWVLQLLRHRRTLFDIVPQRLVWCQGVDDVQQEKSVRSAWLQQAGDFVDPTSIIFYNGFPSSTNDGDSSRSFFHPHDLVVVDDLQGELAKSVEFTAMFTKLAHHKPLVCLYLCQNLFHKSDGEARSRSLSAGYICLMRNVRDKSVVMNLGRQMFPGQAHVLTRIYEDATNNKPFSYLLIDLRQETPDVLRFRTNIFPSPSTSPAPIVYLPTRI
jgi:hypothetical protein